MKPAPNSHHLASFSAGVFAAQYATPSLPPTLVRNSGEILPSAGRPFRAHNRTFSTGSGDNRETRSHCIDIGRRFGDRLRDLRRTHKMTQIDMAVAFGIDRSYISDVECGKCGISLATLEIIALGFHIALADLLRDI
jgi:DNA-binding XRE family transcriptional regulator